MVKLARVLMLGPVVVFFALRHRDAARGEQRVSVGKIIPWFVIGFVALAALRSLGAIPEAAANSTKGAAAWLTIAAMAALGLSVDVRSVRQVGARVVIAVGGSSLTLIVLAVTLIKIL